MPAQERQESKPDPGDPSMPDIEPKSVPRNRTKSAPSVQLDLNGFISELREWIDAVKAGKWDEASERLRDACDEAYCLEGWLEFTNRLGTSNMQHHVHSLRRFLVAVETTARALNERQQDETECD
jgi:hypothetical protein